MTDRTNTPTQIDDETLDMAGAGLLLPAVQAAREAAATTDVSGISTPATPNTEAAVNSSRYDPYKNFKFK